ncbi:hypothetical protein [Pseudomarimonas arenosa]|uniref:Uncharacterized protein n=1 Tax=Pseudomarimonas arenosa TaxID=2774145 RepID=A0AAW3ZRV5_9GAMM|nr:hypothetical protein [Pseudomarimonas arenosa]MBD8527272.1 hypothetical protein [Pseudomarimonas arenosa]
MEHIIMAGDGYHTVEIDIGLADEGLVTSASGNKARGVRDGVRLEIASDICQAVLEDTDGEHVFCVLAIQRCNQGAMLAVQFMTEGGLGGAISVYCGNHAALPNADQASFRVELWDNDARQVVATWAGRWFGPNDIMLAADFD